MLPTNRQPPGLLSFFGVKNGGTNPGYEMDRYIATCDLRDWVLNDPVGQEVLTGTFNVANTSPGVDSQFLLVPAGQVWVVLDVTLRSAVIAAATNMQVTLGIFYPSQTAAAPVTQISEPSQVFTTGGALGLRAKGPWWVAGGGGLAYTGNVYTGAAPTVVTYAARIQRLQF